MAKFVTPQVYWVGYSTVFDSEIDRYLRDSGNEEFRLSIEEARKTGISNAEILCSMFAKLCYKSLTIGQNTNITRTRDIESNLCGVFDVGHGSVFEHVNFNFIIANCSRVFCYVAGAEVFTSAGWKKVEALTVEDELLVMDPETRLASFTKPESVHSFDYSGLVYGWQSSQMTSPEMTADHTIWAAPYDLRRAHGLSNDENVAKWASKVQIQEMYEKRFSIDHGVRMGNVNDSETIKIGGYGYDAYDLLSWLGWMATDGHMPKSRPNQCTISQSKLANIAALDALMDSLFVGCWRRHGPYDECGGYSFTISDEYLAAWARDMIGPNKAERHLSPELFLYSPRLLRGFYDALLSGDGSIHQKNGHEVLYCPNEHVAGQYQVIIAMLGKSANVRTDDRTGHSRPFNGTVMRHNKPSYVISINRKSASLVKISHQFRHSYDGKVYCPKTKHGLIYVRQKGMAFWSGNTHELVRHRAGTAFSQTSGRYCRLDSIDFVHDPILDEGRDLIRIHLQNTEQLVYDLECRCGLRKPGPVDTFGNPGPWVPNDKLSFDRKKKLTSAIRRIAPNGQANEMAFSVNLRALRHTIMLRTDPHAEWEIRCVFAQIYELLKEQFVTIFHGAKETMVDGLVHVSGMKMQPYEKSADEMLAECSDEALRAELSRRGFSI